MFVVIGITTWIQEFFIYGSHHIAFLSRCILNPARAQGRVEILSTSNELQLFLHVPLLIATVQVHNTNYEGWTYYVCFSSASTVTLLFLLIFTPQP